MKGDPRSQAGWREQATSVMRRALMADLKPVPRREPVSESQLRPQHGPAAGIGGNEGRPYDRLEEGFALLSVLRVERGDGRDAYELKGWCGDLTVEISAGSTRLRAPDISLRKAMRGGEYPSEILRGIQLWSQNQNELSAWINEIRDVHGAALRLIVWDDTGFELPWELFWVPGDEQRGLSAGWLGALLVMARWTTLRVQGQDLPRETGDCHGRVLGYLHEDMADDGSVFKPFAHHMHLKMTSFLKALETPADRIGLIYMGCHGEYGDTVARLSLGGRTWAELNSQTMHILRADRSLVCLNACHSGLFVRNSGQGEQALRGFAELFLRKGAGGCIVAVGQVGDQEARALVRSLVGEVTAQPDRPVTETLRAFRARAVAEFGPLAAIPTVRNDDGQVDKFGQKRVLRLLYAFMFHYYGHPLTTVRLTVGEGYAARGGGGW